MNPISEQDLTALADAVRRRHRSSGRPPEVLDVLERHGYRVSTLVDDLAEGESLNALDYHVLRVAAVLHDAARAKASAAGSAEASALLAGEMLAAVGADPEFAAAAVRAVRRHAGTQLLDPDVAANPPEPPETLAEQLVHDACMLARIEETAGEARSESMLQRLRETQAALYSATAQRIASRAMDATEQSPAASIGGR